MNRQAVAFVLAVTAALAFAASAIAREHVTAPPTTFTDPSGDAGTAADITSLTATNDDKGQYTLVATFATPYPATGEFWFNFDTDLNPGTGDPELGGVDYLLYDDHSQHAFDLEKWNGTSWDEAPTTSTVSITIAPDGKSLTASINASELGNSTGFNFWLNTDDGSSDSGHYDVAPDGSATWQYKQQTVFTLTAAAARQTAATAGKTWMVFIGVVRSDTGKTVGSEGTITCGGSSGSTKLPPAARAFITVSGTSVASCIFRVPKTLKHKSVKGTISVSLNGQTVSHTFTTKVK